MYDICVCMFYVCALTDFVDLTSVVLQTERVLKYVYLL